MDPPLPHPSNYLHPSLHNFPTEDWLPIEFDTLVSYDLFVHPLQFTTDAVLGSGGRINLEFYDEGKLPAGQITIGFHNESIDFLFGQCNVEEHFQTLPMIDPWENPDKSWTIYKAEGFLFVECNGEFLLGYEIELECESEEKWNWDRNVRYIQFESTGRAPTAYRRRPSKFTIL